MAGPVKRSSTPTLIYSTVESMERYLEIYECRREFEHVKEVPLMAIIYVQSLMERAWTWERIVPWRAGYVPLGDYMDYLDKYFEKNVSLLPDARAEAKRCLKMEKKYLDSRLLGGALTEKDDRLSRKITKLAEEILHSGSSSITATVGLMCIAEEAKLMSKLKSGSKLFKFSNEVRRSASKLMMYEGPESQSIATGMLGMAVEARIASDLLVRALGKDPEPFDRFQICKEARECSLDLLIEFKRTFALEPSATSTTDKTEGKSADGNFARNETSTTDKTERKSADDNFAGNKISVDGNKKERKRLS